MFRYVFFYSGGGVGFLVVSFGMGNWKWFYGFVICMVWVLIFGKVIVVGLCFSLYNLGGVV